MTSTTSSQFMLISKMSARLQTCRPAALLAIAFSALLASGDSAKGQYINTYFPTGVPGYSENAGVTVLSRLRPLYDTEGINVDSFVVKPRLDETFGYDSNPSGGANNGSSLLLRTAPSLTATSNWSRDALGFSISAENYEYFDLPQQDYTNWTISIGGGYTIGRSNLTLAYSHLSLNQNATEVGALQSQTPVHYTVDDVRTGYTFDLGRISISPSIDLQYYNFGNATFLVGSSSQSVSQAYRDRVVLTGGVTTRYELGAQRGLLFVVQGVDSRYTDEQLQQPTNDSTSVLALAGLDYQPDGPWRYQVLGGIEERNFKASQYQTHTAPIIAGDVVWTPTGLTTVTGSIARTIEAPSSEGSDGYTYTIASLVVDHELYRNILLEGRTRFQNAQYLQGGGSDTSYSLGVGINWLLNRNVRLSLDYGFTQQTGSQGNNTNNTNNGVPNQTSASSGSFTRNLVLLGLHFAM
jgi:hypothetical protein